MEKKFVVRSILIAAIWVVLCAPAFGQGAAKDLPLTKENPIRVDEQEKSVSFLAEVNGKYFFQSTRHAAIFKGGEYEDKAIFRSYADPQSFYESLVKLGFRAGNNMTMENREKTFVEGDLLDVTITWAGMAKRYDLQEVIRDSSGKPIQMRFGGHIQNSLKYGTGCLFCLDSCPVGIGSNASYTNGAVEKRKEVSFTGRKEVLPPDKTLVVFTVKRKP